MDFLPMPRFSSERLALWFAQAESVFKLNAILSDSDKYDYVVAHIPLDFTSMVEDILLNPPEQSKYDHIKYEFIKRMSIYRLKKEEFGKERPSEYLERLIKIADERVSIEAILSTWSKNLPKPVREIVSLESSGHLEIIGPMADKVMALLTPAPIQRNIEISCDQFEMIMQRIDKLCKQVQLVKLLLDGELSGQQKSLNKHGGEASSGSNTEEKTSDHDTRGPHEILCWYHNILGESAVTCASPCQYEHSSTQYK